LQGLLLPVVAAGLEVAYADAEAADFALFVGGALLPTVAAAMEQTEEAFGRTTIGRKIHEGV
jgi:hypothetical protein